MAQIAGTGNEENAARAEICFRARTLPSSLLRVPSAKPKQENLLLNLVCNLALPTYAFMQLSRDNRLGPLWGGLVALAFPLSYGVYDFIRRRKTNFVSVIGIVSILLSGGLLVGQAGGFWFAIKDGALPLVIGVTVIATVRAKNPLVRELFFNEQIIDVARVDAALAERGQREAFDKLMLRTSLWLGAAFVVMWRSGHPAQSILGIIAINMVFSFVVPGISWQGHLGGLVVGALVAAGYAFAPRERRRLVAVVLPVVTLVLLVALTTWAYGQAPAEVRELWTLPRDVLWTAFYGPR